MSQSYDRMNKLKCCVIVPTYNNHKTLKRVLDGILVQTSNIIVVNDGSTDSTKNILADYPNLVQIHLEKNQGKGNALMDLSWLWPWLACVSGHPLDRKPGDTRAEAATRAAMYHARSETVSVPRELCP